jgi:hypothetical protein
MMSADGGDRLREGLVGRAVVRTHWRCAVAVAITCIAAAAPADAASRVFLPNCGNSAYGGRVEPSSWDAGCTGQRELIHATWTGWGRDVAVGRGFTPSACDPDCASGTLYKFRARLRVSRVRTCRGKTGRYRRFYTRARLRYRVPPDHPAGIGAGLHAVRFRLVCFR